MADDIGFTPVRDLFVGDCVIVEDHVYAITRARRLFLSDAITDDVVGEAIQIDLVDAGPRIISVVRFAHEHMFRVRPTRGVE